MALYYFNIFTSTLDTWSNKPYAHGGCCM